jgi:hypothetical protein
LPVGTYWRCDARITGTSVGNLVRRVFIGVILTESALDDVRLLAALAFIHIHSCKEQPSHANPYALRLTPYALRLTPYALRLTPYA